MRQLAIVFTLLLTFAFTVAIAQEMESDGVFTFETKMGTVTFDHTAHQEAWSCDACHPAFPQKYDDSISIKDEAHKTCKACHQENGGPTSCKTCHVK